MSCPSPPPRWDAESSRLPLRQTEARGHWLGQIESLAVRALRDPLQVFDQWF